ncbi:MAG: hypothetical protein O8C66_12025 [Candidatus Methanoperedens sp.]|nr:hypothetical protein [Candidatus Methanoperedens sp.]MCZ7371229.1 hypothetical protein [Candidatus Methanoperedens sp.]
MVDWTSFPISIIYRAYSYFKKYFDLNKKENALVAKEVQLNNLEQELTRLKEIRNENLNKYSSMIEFNSMLGVIKAEDNNPSPSLEFTFVILNFSIFDFKTKKITMRAIYEDISGHEYELGTPIPAIEEMEVTHQQHSKNSAKLQPLHTNFITILKSLKKESKKNSIRIRLNDVKIDFIGDKQLSKSWGYNTYFELEIPIKDIHVTL